MRRHSCFCTEIGDWDKTPPEKCVSVQCYLQLPGCPDGRSLGWGGSMCIPHHCSPSISFAFSCHSLHPPLQLPEHRANLTSHFFFLSAFHVPLSPVEGKRPLLFYVAFRLISIPFLCCSISGALPLRALTMGWAPGQAAWQGPRFSSWLCRGKHGGRVWLLFWGRGAAVLP